MTIEDFNNLTIPEQGKTLEMHGLHLFNYNEEKVLCQVYKLSDFFVKLRYKSNNKEECEIHASSNADDFPLYEHHIFTLLGEF